MSKIDREPLIVVGLDGAGFELLDPWIADEALPNLKRLRSEGVWSDLESCLPPVTCPNWKCYATGCNPGKLGLFWWEKVDLKRRTIGMSSGAEVPVPDFWELLAKDDLPVAVVNVPTTFPPKKLNGVVVAGGPDCLDRDYFFPRDIAPLLNDIGYRPHPFSATITESNREELCKEVYELIDLRFRLIWRLIDEGRYCFFHVTTFYINMLQHFLWNAPEVLQAWKIIDKWLGKLADRTKNIILMSDHGSNPIVSTFHINRWLEQQGYLTARTSLGDYLKGTGINRDKIRDTLDRIGLGGIVRRMIPADIRQQVPDAEGNVAQKGKADKINWDRSLAVAGGQGPIYLLGDSERRNRIRDELCLKIKSVRVPGTDLALVKHVYTKDEIYCGPFLDQAPDLIIDQAPGIHIDGSIGKEDVFSSPVKWRAENKRHGIFVAWGRKFRHGQLEDRLSILDLAPTILAYYGIPAPKWMDGRIRGDVLDK